MDYAANVTLFLLEKTGSIYGEYAARMTAAEQRALFGKYLGKGLIIINGETNMIVNRVKVCFGLDWDDRNHTHFRDLPYTSDAKQ
jgi:hypothetical protein